MREREKFSDRFAMAVAFAANAHAGQVYKGHGGREDEPYILHPLRVALAVSAPARIVAVLHDVFEDTAERAPEWINEAEARALFALTRLKNAESYEDYVQRILSEQGPSRAIAHEVKRADLRENLSRNPPPHLRERYEKALAWLTW